MSNVKSKTRRVHFLKTFFFSLFLKLIYIQWRRPTAFISPESYNNTTLYHIYVKSSFKVPRGIPALRTKTAECSLQSFFFVFCRGHKKYTHTCVITYIYIERSTYSIFLCDTHSTTLKKSAPKGPTRHNHPRVLTLLCPCHRDPCVYIPVAGLWRNSLGNTSIQHPLRIIFVLFLPLRRPSAPFGSIKCAPKAPNQSNSMRSKITHPIVYIYIYKGRESICKGLIRPLCDFIGRNYIHYYFSNKRIVLICRKKILM